jgi:hypothetical protein
MNQRNKSNLSSAKTTCKSAFNIYTYIATRTKLEVSKAVTIAGKTIVYNFAIDVVSGSSNQQERKKAGGNPDMKTILKNLEDTFSNLMKHNADEGIVGNG